MKKYYIKSFFGDWTETTREHYERFCEHLMKVVLTGEDAKREILAKHAKVVEEL